ncbi:MAG TPA: carbohydrate-binding protein, partial [Flavisolibacter sp.]|nr:carbohydrate-binding protein [Flavisolibacter sp.]
MKSNSSWAVISRTLMTGLLCSLLFSTTVSARKIYLSKGSDNGIYLNAKDFAYGAGDTLVLRASQNPFAYLSLEGYSGMPGAPIVVINEGGQVQVSAMAANNCTYMKFTGTGSADRYGFYMTSPNQTVTAPAFNVSGRSSDIEIDHADIYMHGYGMWIKQEGSCDPLLQYPNWRINNISVHDNRMSNLAQEGIYAGSTAPNGERPVSCNGVTTYPLPVRLGNVKIYNNIIDHTGRGAIQLSNSDYGSNEIYNNTVTNAGFEFVPSQGNGIVLGGYTSAYVHDNTIDYTFSSGIFSLGSGLIRIENNKVDHSGQLAGRSADGSASIMVDTRLTNPVMPTTFQVKNNTLGANTDNHFRVYLTYNTYAPTGNILCNNLTPAGGAITSNIPVSINVAGCSGVSNQLPLPNAGPDQTVSVSAAQVTLNGSAIDPDGSIAVYKWAEVSGPNNATLSATNTPVVTATGLVAGTYMFRLTVTDNGGATASDDVIITVSSSAPAPTSQRIEAESYTAMSGIQTENTGDAGGGLNVGWQENNDWMDYSVNVPAAGTYTVNFRVATTNTGVQFQLRNASGTSLATVTVPNTGWWQTYQTVSAQVTLPAGQQTLRIVTTDAKGSGWNINWWEIVSSPAPPPGSGTIRIEAEKYSSMSGIQTENTGDIGGGLNVGWQENNDWMDYSVNVASAGTYTVNFRVATTNTGVQFQLRNASGTALATVTVPNTGWWQTYQTISAQVTLPAGQQTLRIVTTDAKGSGWNINWWEIVGTATPPPPPPTTTSIKIEAESYTAMSGIQTENTGDAGGGLNVGWQENNDWMDYSVNVPAAGTYTVNFGVATTNTGVQFQLRNSSGTSLATVTVPNTGWWQTYQTISAQVTLPAGQQTLRIYTTDAKGSGWNINWWQITNEASQSIASASAAQATDITAMTASLQLFPNPVTDRFALSVVNDLSGAM